MSEEEIKEIFSNLKEYIQNKIDSGEHKIYYNDLDWDVKCIDCITAIDNILELYNKQKEEIKELKKYDYRNIKIDDNNKIYSPNFTEGELHFMNFGIALYLSMQNFDKLNDKNDI